MPCYEPGDIQMKKQAELENNLKKIVSGLMQEEYKQAVWLFDQGLIKNSCIKVVKEGKQFVIYP